MYNRLRLSALVFFAASLFSTATMANGLSTYSQDFDGLDINGSEIGAGWIYFNNVFNDGVYLFGYAGVAPN